MTHFGKDLPLVSICIPVFNGGDLIYHALESCIHQTYKYIEIIVADNASSDGTEDVVKKYATHDKRVRYFRQTENIGPTKNFLSAFELASGEYVQLLAHDDWLSKNYIEECVESFLANPEAAVVVGGLISLVVSEDGFFNFDREIGFDSKRYFVQHFLGDLRNNQMASLIIYSMARRQDIVEATRLCSKLFDTPSRVLSEEVRELHKKGFGIDIVISQKLLSKYGYFVFNNKIRYIKVDHATNTGKTAGAGVDMQNAQGIINNYFYYLLCNEYLYSTLFKPHLSRLRLSIGTDMCGELVLGFFKSRLRANYFKALALKNLHSFFGNYTFLEKVTVVGIIVPSLISRVFSAVVRKSAEKKPAPFGEKYFLNSVGRFVF